MNITFLIGNGFDIQCGLKSSYIDFYRYILKEKYNINIEELGKDSKQIESSIDNLIYLEIYRNIDNLDNWADLEMSLGALTKDLHSKNKDSSDVASNFLHSYEELSMDLSAYLTKIQIQDKVNIDDDFSNELFITMDNFFANCLDQESEAIRSKLTNNRSNLTYNFISFNYTNTLEVIFDNCKLKSKNNIFFNPFTQTLNPNVIHVHGKVDRFLTLGLNDVSQLAVNFFDPDDVNDLLKPETLIASRDNMQRNAEKMIDTSGIIVIFGMSLGATDKYWWERIANWLLKNKERKLIIHHYEPNPSMVLPRTVRRRRVKRENNFISHLTNLDLSSDNISQLKKQMYIISGNNSILNIDLKKYLMALENNHSNIVEFDNKELKLTDVAT